MASPFSIFRKNKKLMMAMVTILALLAFVFLPIIGEVLGTRSPGPANLPVVSTAKYGNLSEAAVGLLIAKRRAVFTVLADALQAAGIPPTMSRQYLESRFGSATEKSVVAGWLLTNYANKHLGMVVSKAAVNNFLLAITQGRVKPEAFVSAFKRTGMSESQFMSAMIDELTALQVREMFEASLAAMTPAERWDCFLRLKQNAAIEAVGISTADFVGRVDEPSDEVLKAFFEKHKNNYPMPNLSEPGFREPPKVALEFFKAEYEKFAAMVSDEEIKQRYEKNKEVYDEPKKKAESETGDKAPLDDVKDVKETKKPDAKKSDDVKAKAEPKAVEKSKNSTKPKSPKAPKQEKKESKKTSAVDAPSPFVLTAWLQEDKAKEEAKPAKVKKESSAAKDKPTAVKKETPVIKKETPAVKEKPAEPKSGLTDAIKNRIRREIAYEKMQKTLDSLRTQIEPFRSKWSRYKVDKIHQQEKKTAALPTPPERPDFVKLAKAAGLAAGQTELLPQWQVQSLDVGASLVGGRDPVWNYAFSSLTEFKLEESGDLKGDLYLLWKTDESKDRVPKFEDKGVREEVLRVWKLVEARALAMKQAETLAEEAAKAGKPLAEFFAGKQGIQVVTPPAFSWLTFGAVPFGSAPGAIRTSEVTGMDYIGEEFMRAVFGLEPGKTAAAMNAPKTVAYLIRLKEFSPSDAVLWKQFEVDDFSKYAPAAGADRQQMRRAWFDEIKTFAGFKWEREPDQPQEDRRYEEE